MTINDILDNILNQRLSLDEYGLHYLYPEIHKNLLSNTLPIFSQKFPCYRRYQYVPANNATETVGEYYLNIPEIAENGLKIISVANVIPTGTVESNAAYDAYTSVNLSIDDIILNAAATNTASLAKLSFRRFRYVAPNRIKLKGYGTSTITVELKISYPSFTAIADSVIEQFLDLATSDVCIFLYNKLKHFENLQLPIGNIELKLDTIQKWADMRDDIINRFDTKGYPNRALRHYHTFE